MKKIASVIVCCVILFASFSAFSNTEKNQSTFGSKQCLRQPGQVTDIALDNTGKLSFVIDGKGLYHFPKNLPEKVLSAYVALLLASQKNRSLEVYLFGHGDCKTIDRIVVSA